jgi:hypothetical protein
MRAGKLRVGPPVHCRHLLRQRFVGTRLVVVLAKAIEARLLLGGAPRWRPCRLRLQCAVHALVPAVLLGIGGANVMRLDPEL